MVGADQRARLADGEARRQRVQVGGGSRYWADAPDAGPDDWGARFVVTLLFPK